jgi:PAS domain S-box-containing protein
MLHRIRAWFATPVFADRQKTYFAMLMNAPIVRLFGVLGIAFLGVVFVFPAKWPSAAVVFSFLAFLVLCKFLLNGGQINLARLIFIGGLYLVSTALVVFSGGAASVNMMYYVAVIVLATLLYGNQGGQIAFGVIVFSALVIVIAGWQGWLPPRIFPVPPQSGWFMLVMAAMLVLAALGQAIKSRDTALEALRESEAKYRSLFEAISTAIIVMEKGSGVILDVNGAAEKLYGYARQQLIGKTIMDLSAEPDETRRAIQGGSVQIPLRYHRRSDGSTFPAEIYDNVMEWEGREIRIGSVRDISERLNAQQREQSNSRRLSGIISAAQQLLTCASLDDVYRQAVELGRAKLGLERCAIFLLDEAEGVLVGTYGTDDQGHTTDEHAARVPLREGRLDDASTPPESWRIRDDDVSHWQEGQPVMTHKHWTAATFIRANMRAIGVFFNDANITHAALDPAQQEAVAVYCSLLGSIIEQKRAEARRDQVSKGLRAVIDSTDELIQCPDLDSFCRRAVELARQKLGVERCGLYLFDAEQNRMRGTYGTDIAGNIINEAAITWPTDLSQEMARSIEKTWSLTEGEYRTLVGDENKVVGHGWNVQTVLRLGAEPIGIFFNDTAISRAPVDPLQQEVIAIYCSLLENMIKQKHVEAALKRATLSLRVSEERYRQAIEAAGAVPYLQDYERRAFTFIGENIFQLTGYSADEMTPAFWDTLVEEAIPGGEAAGLSEKEAIPLARSGKLSQWLCDYRIRTRLGETRWIADCAVEIFDEHGTARGSIGILQDITSRKQAEAEREKLIAELETKNAELERFTYTVSHDLKSPLITIQGFLGYLQKDAEQGNLERLRADMARITDATVRMQHLLNDLLELSRIGRIVNPPKHIPFLWIVEEALSLVKGRLDRGGVKVVYDPDLPFVYGDSARLVEVVQNLVDNAAKFMEGQPNPQVEIGQQGSDAGGFVTFYVCDNGMGIPPQYHERIFGLFNKLDAKSEGTGVGLALVKRIVEVHGGKIWVESDGVGQGSTFYFTLPGNPPH